MMKKYLISGFFLVLCFLNAFGQDASGDTKTAKTALVTYDSYLVNENKSGYDTIINENLGREISVNLKDNDTIITGALTAIYNDGIVLKSLFNIVYIPKQSISFIRLKTDIIKKK